MSPFAIASVLFGTRAAGDGRGGVARTGAPSAVFVLARLRYFAAPAWRLRRTLGKRLLGVRVVGRRLRLGHLAAGTAIARASVLMMPGAPPTDAGKPDGRAQRQGGSRAG